MRLPREQRCSPSPPHSLTTPAQAAANAHCAESSMTLPPGALYPNGIARAADSSLYVGLITSGNVLRKRPGKAWKPFPWR